MAAKNAGSMKKKKTNKPAIIAEEKSFSISQLRAFVDGVKAEFDKIGWPSRKITTGLTGFVILLVIVVSIYLGTVDLLLGKLVTYVLK